MSQSIKILAVLGLAVFVSACGNDEEDFVVVEPEPISAEPIQTGKYK